MVEIYTEDNEDDPPILRQDVARSRRVAALVWLLLIILALAAGYFIGRAVLAEDAWREAHIWS